MENYKTIIVEKKELVANLWFNRPEKHNALNPELMEEVIHFFHTIENDETIRMVVIRGKGKSLCSGADLKWMSEATLLSRDENLKEGILLTYFFSTIYNSSKITIGVAHGNIFGGGNGLLAACDLAYGLKECNFSLSETKLGLIAASITPYMLLRMNPSVYKELIFTARTFNGKEAETFGLINKSFQTQSELEIHLESTLEAVKGAGPKSLAGSKQLINDLLDPSKSEEVMEHLPSILAEVRISSEACEGFSAFLEKRKPRW
jgi:methylglutaconyl-CoA hydratase